MSLFALPFTHTTGSYINPPSTSNFLIAAKKKKRKRNSSSSSYTGSDSTSDGEECSKLDISTNPLSLSPDEIIQYKLAGLELNQTLPKIPGWPHRGFPAQTEVFVTRSKKIYEREGEENLSDVNDTQLGTNLKVDQVEEENKKFSLRPGLRTQHLNVLIAILHRCLLNGDIPRAGRAWALLLRMRSYNKGVDLRGSGYWGIGAELLIRSLHSQPSEANDFDDESEIGEVNLEEQSMPSIQGVSSKWNLLEGLRRAVNYYERLILQYPYIRQFSSTISALDWWPIMIVCEIYRVQLEQKEALQKLEMEVTFDREQDFSTSDDFPDQIPQEKSDEFHELSSVEKHRKKQDHYWQSFNQIRLVALSASENIAQRLDERMIIPPFSENHDLLRLRGMLALHIGDLKVPPKPKQEEKDTDRDTLPGAKSIYVDNTMRTRRRLVIRGRIIEYEKGLARRAEEINMAKGFFEKLIRAGGGDLINKKTVDIELEEEDIENEQEDTDWRDE